MEIVDINTTRKSLEKIEYNHLCNKQSIISNRHKLGAYDTIMAYDFEVLTHNNETEVVSIARTGVDESTGKRRNNADSKIDLYELPKSEKLKLVIELLSSAKSRGRNGSLGTTLNFFFNLKYDLSILISLLPQHNIRELQMFEQTELKVDDIKYNLKLLGYKSFSITNLTKMENSKSNKRKNFQVTYYDIANIVYNSLDNAYKEWVGDGKVEKAENLEACIGIIKNIAGDIGEDYNLTEIVYNNKKIFEAIKEKALDYNLNDCYLTARLAQKIKSIFESLPFPIPFDKPFSTASLYKSFARYHAINTNSKTGQNLVYYPGFTPVLKKKKILEDSEEKLDKKLLKLNNKWERLQSLSYQGYYGGWFEFFKRGYFQDIYGLDYASMYPSIQRNLINIDNMKLYELDGDQQKMKRQIKGSQSAIIKAKVWMFDNATISPFAVKAKLRKDKQIREKIIYPILKGQEVVMSKEKYTYLTEGNYPHIEKIEITEGFVMFPKNEFNRRSKKDKPFDFLNDLYDLRLRFKKEDDGGKREKAIKILINSAYGVLAEVNNVIEVKEDGGMKSSSEYDKSGSMFRPYYAFMVTEIGRLKILKDIFDYDLEDNIIGVATDCLYLDNEGYQILKASDRVNDARKEFGKLETDYHGELITIGNGMYQFKPLDKEPKRENIKMTTRGFSEKNFPNLFTFEGNSEDSFKVINKRPRSWKECVNLNDKTLNQIGIFENDSKECNINMDIGRQWDREFKNIKDLQKSQIDSKPLVIDNSKPLVIDNSK